MATLIGRYAQHQAGSPVVELSEVTIRYNGTPALEDVSFRLTQGERVAVVGPNGAGKSTLFKVIAGMLHPTKGKVKVYGHGPSGHICIAYVPQRSQVDWTFPVNVADVVMMGRIGKLGLLHWPKPRDWDYVHQCLEVVGMANLADRQIGELSGGQQQRVFIARALAQEAELMLMDEPLTGLDVTSQEDIFRIFEELRRRNVTVLVATHDLNLAAERFDRVMLLNHRLLGLGQPDEVFTPERLMQAYGGHMRLIQTDEGVMALSDTCCEGGDEAH
jgi:manganese/iron transport system ATP-binding protein